MAKYSLTVEASPDDGYWITAINEKEKKKQFRRNWLGKLKELRSLNPISNMLH